MAKKAQESEKKNDFEAVNKDLPRKVVKVRHYQQFLTLAQVLSDTFSVVLSFLLGFAAWKVLGPFIAFEPMEAETLDRYLPFLGVSLITTLVGIEVHGLYKPQRSLMNVREFELLLKVWVKSCLFTLGILYLAQQLYFSRGVFLLAWAFLFVILLGERYAFFKFNNWLRRKGVVQTTTLVYGAGEVGRKLIEKFKQSPKLGIHVAGFIDDNPDLKSCSIKGVPVLGDFTHLRSAILSTQAERLFIALSQVPSKVVIDILNVCRETGCDFQIVPSLYDIVIQRVKVSELEGIPLLGVQEPKLSWPTRIGKRLFDLFAGSILFIALSPVFLVLALAVKLSSKGPIIFVQKRIGYNGKRFRFFKFRSMFVDAPMYSVTPQHGHDPRITPVGRFLRRSSLDELPQLWSVLKGDMSLVGPRPEMPFIVSKYNDLQRQRLNVKPGITGLWQISADRKNAIHENMDYDIYYINNQSFMLDMVILLKTVTSVFRGVGAS